MSATTWSIHDRGRTLERGILTSGFAMPVTTTPRNIAVGALALAARTTGSKNVMLGREGRDEELSIARGLSPKLAALLHYIAPRARTSAHLRIVAAYSDFEAYRNLGHSITGINWRTTREFAYPDELSERQWQRETQRIWRRYQPLHLVVAGDVIAAWGFLSALRARWR